MSNDLWPDFEAEKVENPKSFLVEQANFLSKKTKNVLVGDVKSAGDIKKKIVHSFDILAPALSNYRFNLFHIRHELLFYPLDFIYQNQIIPIESEEELTNKMKEVFNSEDTKKILNSLYSQSI
jgi:hypothetical protein